MKLIHSIAGILCLSVLLLLPSCNGTTTTPASGNWVHRGDFPGVPRAGSFTFVINNVVYIGLGYSGISGATAPHYVGDCYSYDGHVWRDIAPFPGVLRERAVAFSIGGKGYVGTGYNRDLTVVQMKDFWQYDPTSDQWTQLNDFGGAGRYNAVGFANENYGFVGTGYDGTLYNDFWKYNPLDDSWTKIQTYDGQKRQSAVVFQIDGLFYLMSGINNNSPIYDAWSFNPAEGDPSKSWVSVAPLTTDAQYTNFKAAVTRYDAVSFTLDGKGYLATGVVTGSGDKSVWQYDPIGLTWTKMTNFERAQRSKAVAATIGGRIFLGTGFSGGNYYDDVEEFFPLADYDAND